MSDNIVFLDASTVDFGDISFKSLEELGSFTPYDYTERGAVVERCRDAAVVITNKVPFDRDVLDSLPDLKFIAVSATGYNIVDVDTAAKRGIPVANVPGYSTVSVAQLTVTFILALATSLVKYNEAARDGSWSSSPVYTLGTWPTFELSGKTVGIMGYGAIGSEVARLCRSFGMRVLALKRGGEAYSDDVERCDLHSIAAMSDFVTIHMPLTEYSRGLVDRKFLHDMKDSAYLINMARGPIIDPRALLWALEEGEIAGAALDVMDREPPPQDDPLLEAPNIILTPHIAWASVEARKKLVLELAQNIRSFQSGTRRNIVNML